MRPTVTIVFLVFNRRDKLRESLRQMLGSSDYPPELVDVIVVDNASEDGSSAMVREEFPQVRLISRERNVGVSAWNDGFAVARGDYVLALDDDCYLPGDGLSRAVAAAQEHEADLVSVGVVAAGNRDWRFHEKYRTGLLTFWGCAVLVRRAVLERLGGYDPRIFVWANELEFMIRFFDAGFRHLHAPDILAVHMQDVREDGWRDYLRSWGYRVNARNFAYIAGKLLAPRDAVEAFVAVLAAVLREALRGEPVVARAAWPVLTGFLAGLRSRAPVSPRVSRTYRQNFHSFASPWWLSRTPRELLRGLPRELAAAAMRRPRPRHPQRRERYMQERARYYPSAPATLEM